MIRPHVVGFLELRRQLIRSDKIRLIIALDHVTVESLRWSWIFHSSRIAWNRTVLDIGQCRSLA